MSLSIIIVNYNSTKFIVRLLKTIREFLNDIEYEIIIVDNNSSERDIEKLVKENTDIKFLFLKKNYGFGYANNRGMEIAKYNYYFLLNPDTYFVDGSIKLMIDAVQNNPQWGIIGPMVKYADGGIQESALHFPNVRYEIYTLFGILGNIIKFTKRLRRKLFNDKEYETDFVFGSCMLIRKELNDIILGFDEDYFLFTEETDYCYRTRNFTNFKIIYFPKSTIYHEAGAITGKKPLKRFLQGYNSKLIFIVKHYKGLYSFLMRYTIILLFIKKLLYGYLSKNVNYSEMKEYYLSIIKDYRNKTPQLNDVK